MAAGQGMVLMLAALFGGWLALALVRVWNLHRSGDVVWTAVVVLLNQADCAEGLVRRLAAGRNRDGNLHPVLVDGGSADETPLILERLARRLNLGWGCLEEMASGQGFYYLDLRHLVPGEMARCCSLTMEMGRIKG